MTTSGRSNLTKKGRIVGLAAEHGRFTSYSPGCANVHPHVTHASLGPSESTTQTASPSVQPFLQGSQLWQTDRQTALVGL